MDAYEPAFSHVLHIRPWEYDLLTWHQWERGRRFIDDMVKG